MHTFPYSRPHRISARALAVPPSAQPKYPVARFPIPIVTTCHWARRSPVTPNDLLERLATVQTHKAHDQRAPHKPLMLLFALGRVGSDPGHRLIPYATAEAGFRKLWDDFGRPGRSPKAHYPFWRLRNDNGLWEIPDESSFPTTSKGDLLIGEAKDLRITGGFAEDVHDLLRRQPTIVSRAALQILSDHFPPSLHGDILEAVGLAPVLPAADLDEPMPRRGRKVREYTPRDPRFRREVLAAYDDRCAVCEHDTRFRNRLLGLEAAHIQWHSHDGGDVVPNGLALCSLHHKALDYGALGLEEKGAGFRILVSDKVRGTSRSTEQLLGFRGRPIRPPASPSDSPDPAFVEWHRREVFHP